MNDRPMAFTDHLGELRSRLLRSILAIAVAFFVAYGFHEELFRFLAAPVLEGLRAHGIYKLQALQVTEAIVVYLQASLVGAIVLAVPYVVYQIWAFVAPGLLERERNAALPVVGLISAFFLLGVAFSYYVFLPMIVDFLVEFTVGTGDIALMPTVEKTFSLTTTFLLVFGVVFEMPLIMFFVSALGLMSAKAFLKFGRYFVVLSFVVAAIFTPPDPLSQMLMAVPLCALYFVGVAFAWAGSALRKTGERGLAKAVVAGVFLVFASAVALAGWLWSRPVEVAEARGAVTAGATFATRADPASRLGRAVAEGRNGTPDLRPKAWVLSAGPGGRSWAALQPEAGCPGVEPDPWWQPSLSESTCVVSGPGPETGDGDESFASLDDPDQPVAGVALPSCVVAMMPRGMTAGTDLRFWAEEVPGGLATITLRFGGDPGSRTAVTDWVQSMQERLSPGRPAPGLEDSVLGAVLAWSEGDLEVRQEDDATLVSVTTLPARAARMAARLAAGGVAACGPHGP